MKGMCFQYSSFQILNTEPGRLSQENRATLAGLADVDEIEADRTFLLENIHKYNCLFIGLRNLIDKSLLARASKLKCIVTPTTGLDHIDIETASKKNIKVISLKGETEFLSTVSATAEFTWGILLALIRKIPKAHLSVMAEEWERNNFCGIELRDKTFGIIGFGRIGRMLRAYAQAFGMHVLIYDIKSNDKKNIEFASLSKLLRDSDIISVNASLNNTTKGMLGFKEFSLMKKGAFLVNTSRGEIIKEEALLDSLKTGRIAGAAIDVMASENSGDKNWLKKSPLIAYARNSDNLIITPHIGGVTHESVEKTNSFIIQKLAEFLRNEHEKYLGCD